MIGESYESDDPVYNYAYRAGYLRSALNSLREILEGIPYDQGGASKMPSCTTRCRDARRYIDKLTMEADNMT